jgi:hypothetical protein
LIVELLQFFNHCFAHCLNHVGVIVDEVAVEEDVTALALGMDVAEVEDD